MITTKDIEKEALKYPGTEQSTHFRLPAYKVNDATFIVLQNDDHALFSISKSDLSKFEGSSHIEEVWRNKNIFVGVRAALNNLSQNEISQLTKMAWKHKAPKKLVKESGL